MNIIIPNFPIPIFNNIAQCLETIKADRSLKPLLWQVDNKPMLDMFHEMNPSVIFLHESQLDQAFHLACQDYNFRYIVLATKPIPSTLPKPPELILIHPSLRNQFSSTDPIMEIFPAANVTQMHNAKFDPTLQSDILINTTGVQMSEQINTILTYLAGNYNTKIIGSNPVFFKQYLGQTNMIDGANFIKSTKVLIDFNQHDFWDSSYINIPAISYMPTNESMIAFNNIDELKKNITSLLSNKLIRDKYVQESFNLAKANTYFHVTGNVFKKLKEYAIESTCKSYMELITK